MIGHGNPALEKCCNEKGETKLVKTTALTEEFPDLMAQIYIQSPLPISKCKRTRVQFATKLTCKQAKVSPKNSVLPFERRQIRSKRPKTSVLLWYIVNMRVHPLLASFFSVTIINSAETLNKANQFNRSVLPFFRIRLLNLAF